MGESLNIFERIEPISDPRKSAALVPVGGIVDMYELEGADRE
jgi:hypothetical protein